jgi:RHS repeat-associated protein
MVLQELPPIGNQRFGFQGQETDEELWSGAVSYKYRVEDPRLGRFFSVDPLAPKYAYNSTYAFSENRVIDGVELEGLEFTKYLDRKRVEARTDALIAKPGRINQGGAGTCSMAAITFLWINIEPNVFKTAVMKLYDDGSVIVRDYNIEPDNHLFNVNPVGNSNIYKGKGSDYQADWMILSSLQDSQNSFYDFDGISNDDDGAGNGDSDINEVMKKLLGYTTVTTKTFVETNLDKNNNLNFSTADQTFQYLQENFNTLDGYKTVGGVMALDADLLGNSADDGTNQRHHVAIINNTFEQYTDNSGNIRYKFQVASWGGTPDKTGSRDGNNYKIDISAEEMKNKVYSVIVGKKSVN